MNKPKTFAEQINELTGPMEPVGITSSPSTTTDIVVDITEGQKTARALGQMVFVQLPEDDINLLTVGQIVDLTTRNRWHEDMSFKGVIKKHGALPHLSGVADNRLATVSVQSCFNISGEHPKAHILGVSPSTGAQVVKIDNEVMSLLVKHQRDIITYIGRVYGTSVDMPMWFKHFGKGGKGNESGAGDAYHIGVFGKTGSGKTVTAALMLLGYARNKEMNILVLDPQGQFSLDKDLLPNGGKFQEQMDAAGMTCTKLDLVREVALPADPRLFADLLLFNGFIQEIFGINSNEKKQAMSDSIDTYMSGLIMNNSEFFGNSDPQKTLSDLLAAFADTNRDYIQYVYSPGQWQKIRIARMNKVRAALDGGGNEAKAYLKKWNKVFGLFSHTGKTPMEKVVKDIVSTDGGKCIILDVSGTAPGELENDNLKAVFLQQIERKIAETGGMMYARNEDEKANCLIVMDEAHRFVAGKSPDVRVRELTGEIVDAVRTTRKYGIGHMFITQTLESMDEEIIKQMRVFGFGHGLTTGAELRKVGEIINSKAAQDLYRSFIDPGSGGRYPFMFFGPVSPFSATGAPLFIETYTQFAEFEKKNPAKPSGESGE